MFGALLRLVLVAVVVVGALALFAGYRLGDRTLHPAAGSPIGTTGSRPAIDPEARARTRGGGGRTGGQCHQPCGRSGERCRPDGEDQIEDGARRHHPGQPHRRGQPGTAWSPFADTSTTRRPTDAPSRSHARRAASLASLTSSRSRADRRRWRFSSRRRGACSSCSRSSRRPSRRPRSVCIYSVIFAASPVSGRRLVPTVPTLPFVLHGRALAATIFAVILMSPGS